jgi:MFS family permease
VLLAGFAVAEQRSGHPLLPLRVILDRTRGGSYVAVFISGVAIFATFLFLTYYLQVIKRESPLATGLLFLPMTACILVSSNFASIVGLARVGPRALITIGMALGAGGMAYLTQVTVTSSYASAVLPALLLLGLGFGMIFAPAINTATFGVARRDSGVASALVNTMQQVGGSIGTSALSTIALSSAASYLISHHTVPLAPAIAATHGYTVAFSISAALLGLGGLLAIVLLPSNRRLTELRTAAAAAAAAATGAPIPSPAAPAPQPAFEAIPVALCSCSPIVNARPSSAVTPVR